MGGLLGGLVGAGANLLGGFMGQQTAEDIANKNIAAQELFAQNGIQWKVADANKAGINPLAALGAQTSSFSNITGDNSMGTGVAAAGQDISRAIQSTRSKEDQENAQKKSQLDLESEALDNALKRQKLASSMATANQPGNGPPSPSIGARYLIPGQTPTTLPGTTSTLTKDDPLKRIAVAPENTSQEPGAVADLGFTRTPTGYFPVPSKDSMERMSNDMLGMLAWNLRHRIYPSFGFNENPPPIPARDGYRWRYDPSFQEYRQKKWYGGSFGGWLSD